MHTWRGYEVGGEVKFRQEHPNASRITVEKRIMTTLFRKAAFRHRILFIIILFTVETTWGVRFYCTLQGHRVTDL